MLTMVHMQLQHPRTFPKFLAAKLELKHYLVLTTFAARKRTKNHSVLLSPVHQELSSLFAAELRDRPYVLIAVLMQLQHPRTFPKFLPEKLELKHYLMLTTFAARKRTTP